MSKRREQKQKTNNVGFGIRMKLLGLLLPAIILTITILVLMVYGNVSKMIVTKNEDVLKSKMQGVQYSVEAWMNETMTALNMERDTIEFFPMASDQELNYVKHTADQYKSFPAGIYLGLNDGRLIHASFVPGPEFIMSEKPWYKDGLVSEKFILGAIYFDEDSQSYVVGASGVLKDQNGLVRGVAAADIYLDAISDIVKQVKLEKSGGAFLVDSATGMIIGHKDKELLGTFLKDQTDTMYTEIGKYVEGGTEGLQVLEKKDGSQYYINLGKIPNTDWVAVGYVPRSEVMSGLNGLTQKVIGIAIFCVLLLSVMIIFLVRLIIMRPLKEINGVACSIADGNLDEEISYHSRDEFGLLSDNFNKTVLRLKDYVNYIDEVAKVLDEIAQGELEFELKYSYEGEFSKVKKSLENISYELNQTIQQIRQASDEVSSGSEQIAIGAQTLSQGSVEQSTSIEQLADIIKHVTNSLQSTSNDAQSAGKESITTERNILQCNEKMNNMTDAITEISGKSGEIGKIIKTIEDIAFQTNILALNAAVEAARAGVAGKGFAVVADEVRNLASKSAEAAKSTSHLIEETIKAVGHGTVIAEDTASSMMEVVENSKKITEIIEKIADTFDKEAASMGEVAQGIDQISSVVQTNSATAEESAAASEELSGQAQELMSLVSRFHLRK